MSVSDIDDMQRRTRVNRKVAEAFDILSDAHEKYILDAKKIHAGDCILFSGGNDSTVLAHIFRRYADWAVHINTGICVLDEDADEEVSAAAVYVRERCEAWGLPLIEETGDDYDALVIEHGFPGPAHHFKMYQRLKERGLRKVRKRLVTNGRKERVVFIAGRRRQESERRKDIPAMEREGSVVWVSPLVNWSAEDMADYRKVYDVPLSPVSAELHMSGECCCGAFAKAGELDEIKFWRPRTWRRIKRLEAQALEAGKCAPEKCQWGWGAYRGANEKKPRWITVTLRYCRTCGPEALTDIDEHVENHGTIDHPYDEVVEERQEWWEPKSGPMCSSCTLFDPDTLEIA